MENRAIIALFSMRCGAGHQSDMVGRGGASFCALLLILHSGAPPGALFITAHVIGIFMVATVVFMVAFGFFLFATVFFTVANNKNLNTTEKN